MESSKDLSYFIQEKKIEEEIKREYKKFIEFVSTTPSESAFRYIENNKNTVILVIKCSEENNDSLLVNFISKKINVLEGNCFKVIDLILDLGCDINSRNNSGNTALLIACKENKTYLVEYLLDKGANPNCLNHNRETAIEHSINNRNKDIFLKLIKSKADINIPLSTGNSIYGTLLETSLFDFADSILPQDIENTSINAETILCLAERNGIDFFNKIKKLEVKDQDNLNRIINQCIISEKQELASCLTRFYSN